VAERLELAVSGSPVSRAHQEEFGTSIADGSFSQLQLRMNPDCGSLRDL
jgi:hypothetical protein